DLAANLHLGLIGQREVSVDDGGGTKRLGGQDIQTVLAQVKQDTFHLRTIFDPEFYRKLDGDPEGAASFRSGGTKRLGGQDIQTVLAQVKQDTFHLRTIFDPEFYRKLDGDLEGAASF